MRKLGVILFILAFVSLNGITQSSASVVVPNIFTPNNDGLNDVFRPTYTDIKTVNGIIYNRWGEIVFQWWGLNGYWDGYTLPAGVRVPEGTYYYIINAYSITDEEIVKKGSLTLKR